MDRGRAEVMDRDVRAEDAAAEAHAKGRRDTLIGMVCMAASALMFMSGNAVIKHLAASHR